jgi:hypothetical protein
MYVAHDLNLLRNAGDLSSKQTGHRPEESVKNKNSREMAAMERPQNQRKNTTTVTTQMTHSEFEKTIKFFFFLKYLYCCTSTNFNPATHEYTCKSNRSMQWMH